MNFWLSDSFCQRGRFPSPQWFHLSQNSCRSWTKAPLRQHLFPSLLQTLFLMLVALSCAWYAGNTHPSVACIILLCGGAVQGLWLLKTSFGFLSCRNMRLLVFGYDCPSEWEGERIFLIEIWDPGILDWTFRPILSSLGRGNVDLLDPRLHLWPSERSDS